MGYQNFVLLNSPLKLIVGVRRNTFMKYHHFLYLLIAFFISCQKNDKRQAVDEFHSITTKSGKPFESTSEKVLNHFQKASEYFDNKAFKNAKGEILLALEIEPENSALLNQTGLIFTKLGNYDEAESYLTRSILYDSLNINPYVNLSQLYIWSKRFNDSIHLSTFILKKFSDQQSRFAAYYHLSQAQVNLGDCQLAKKYFNLASNNTITNLEQKTLEIYKNDFLDRKCNTKWFKPSIEN